MTQSNNNTATPMAQPTLHGTVSPPTETVVAAASAHDNFDNIVHAIAGAGGGMVSMAATYPLIVVGTRLSVQKSSRSADPSQNGVWSTLVRIIEKDGVMALYAGLSSALFGIAVTNGVYYYWYELVKEWQAAGNRARGGRGNLAPLQSLLAGALAGSATVLITNPIWMINTRIAVTGGRNSEESSGETASEASFATKGSSKTVQRQQGAWDMVKSVVREEGVLSLWQGVMPALILVSNPSIQYMVFEQLKLRLERLRKARNSALSSLDIFLLGALSKLVATVITYPYIVVKARMQVRQKRMSRSSTTATSHTSPYATTLGAFRTIIKDEGVPGLYKGLNSKIVQSVLTAAILFWAKEGLVDVTRNALLALVGMKVAVSAPMRVANK